MRLRTLLCGFFFLSLTTTFSQKQIENYVVSRHMIPMRDGVRLFTVVFSPATETGMFPVLLTRTPYGAPSQYAEGEIVPRNKLRFSLRAMASDGYIFVFQDIRGKFASEGTFEMTRQLYHLTDKKKVDESTDAFDTIDWLVKNLKNSNGKVGIYGISYPGFTALHASVDPHPALKASSPQASPADMFVGDDFHHNGAFRLSYGFEYCYLVENAKESSAFPFPSYDLYDWYLNLGPLSTVNEKYYHGRLPTWNDFVAHPNYDSFWKDHSSLVTIKRPQLPMLQVGGYYDQEDLNGPQAMYEVVEREDKQQLNHLVLGPWNHGGWAGSKGDSLGSIAFGSRTALWFQDLQKKWFDYWLKGIGDGKFEEAYCFQTGTNQWKTYPGWPPKASSLRKLYAHADGSCSFEPPRSARGQVSYVSDPDKPVPYRELPIQATYGQGSQWYAWHVDDQRFVSTRTDVLTFEGDSLTDNLTVTGKIKVHLYASTTGTDADFVVKLIDVYPDFDKASLSMSGYQFPVAMEVLRGRFRKSLEKPEPFTPGKAEELVIDLHDVNHTFLHGHKLMIQVQSSWFPVIDRNPQKFVPNIFEARPDDFVTATQTIYCNSSQSTYVELPVME